VLEDGEEFGGPAEGIMSPVQGTAHEVLEIVGGGCGPFRGVGCFTTDREDGSLDGLVECRVQAVGAGAERCRNGGGICAVAISDPFSESQQELGQQHPGVAVGAHHARVGHGPGDHREVRILQRRQRVGDGLQCQREVGPRIAVRHWEDVDPIEFFPPGFHPVSSRDETAAEAGTVDVDDAHLEPLCLLRHRYENFRSHVRM
jgi:hypothetical protein